MCVMQMQMQTPMQMQMQMPMQMLNALVSFCDQNPWAHVIVVFGVVACAAAPFARVVNSFFDRMYPHTCTYTTHREVVADVPTARARAKQWAYEQEQWVEEEERKKMPRPLLWVFVHFTVPAHARRAMIYKHAERTARVPAYVLGTLILSPTAHAALKAATPAIFERMHVCIVDAAAAEAASTTRV